MVPSAASCVGGSSAHVVVRSFGPVEVMSIEAKGLPANTNFDVFVIQQPKGPFGMAWYQGDLETDDNGDGHAHFVGRFSIETFMVAPGEVPAPQIFNDPPFPDADTNPATLGPDNKTVGPIQMYHLGIWFNSPDDAQRAGCPAAVTPFNGEHNAGVQVLNTANFPDLQGPLLSLKP